MSVDGTLGSLLQGVSQQPQAVRVDGTVTDQVNFTSDVVQGLTARPALKERASVRNEANTDYRFFEAEIQRTPYIFGYRPGELRMWDTTGVEQTINRNWDEGADPGLYIGTDMRHYVFEDNLYLVNRDIPVETLDAPTWSGVPAGCGIVICLGGLYSRTYRVTITYDDGTKAVGEYQTPDGTSSGSGAVGDPGYDPPDSVKTSAEYILRKLRNSLVNHTNFKGTTVADRAGSTMGIRDWNEGDTFTIQVDDDEDGTSLRAFTTRIDDVEDLSETAYHGMLVRITNNNEGDVDDFYMKFNSDTTNTPANGFGDSGVWEESYNAQEPVSFDLTTMPHVLEMTGAGVFRLSRAAWYPRRVGDENTNPFPDIVGHSIRDIGGFQSRIVLVGGTSCCMSRTDEPLDLFKESAVVDLDTDPISIHSTQDGSDTLDWIIPFDRDLVFMSDPGDGQYIITGNTRITPSNASIVKTTSFEMRGGAKPVETGRTVLFPFKSGIYSGIKEFFTNDDVATNGADTITETVDRYIVGLVDHMRCSTNFNLAVFKTDSADHSNTIWVYKYLWQNTDKLQSSWSKWIMPGAVRHFFFSGSELFFVLSVPAANPAEVDYVFASLDLDIPVDPVAEYHICLDRQTALVADASSAVELPFAGARFVQGTGCATPGREVHPTDESTPDGNGNVTYTFDDETVPEGADVIGGVPYARWVKPTMPFARGRDGRRLPRTHLVVNSFLLHYEETGYIKTIMDSRYRQDPIEFEVDWFALDDDPVDPLGNGLRSGILNAPWGERSDWSELTIYSDDLRPTTIHEIGWTGEVFKGSRE